MSIVNQAIDRMNKLRKFALRETFFPLDSTDLKPVFRRSILPMMLSQSKQKGIALGGPPGIDKTPFAKIWAKIICTYWKNLRNLTGKVGWRRGKKMERFRGSPQQIIELLMLDDPKTDRLNFEELSDYFDLAENGAGFLE